MPQYSFAADKALRIILTRLLVMAKCTIGIGSRAEVANDLREDGIMRGFQTVPLAVTLAVCKGLPQLIGHP